MLGLVDPDLLQRVRFPLGRRLKADVQQRAAELELAAARAPESQEVCFLGGGALAPFLARQGVGMEPGPIVDEDGVELGRHRGARAYTPGQRRGLGVSRGTEALHVLKVDQPRNTLVVGPAGRLGRREVPLRDLRRILPIDTVDACFRLRAPAVPGALVPDRAGAWLVRLERDAFAVAPGQVAVLYSDDAVVAAGVVAG